MFHRDNKDYVTAEIRKIPVIYPLKQSLKKGGSDGK